MVLSAKSSNVNPEFAQKVECLAASGYAIIARTFPVSAASDEFYFFPQVVSKDRSWRCWDDFSPDAIKTFLADLAGVENQLATLSTKIQNITLKIDVDLLLSTFTTLREQLTEVAPQGHQPTFHLTIMAAGLTEAIAESDSSAWVDRVAGAPDFLKRAGNCLNNVPKLFHELGLVMLEDLKDWICQIGHSGRDIGLILNALEEFRAVMCNVQMTENFRLPETLLDRLLSVHLRCGADLKEIHAVLENEYRTMLSFLKREVKQLVPGESWLNACRRIPFRSAPKNDLLNLYRDELLAIEKHCRDRHMVPEMVSSDSRLEVSLVPSYLTVIRASDAYSATPGYPPKGGKFYVMKNGRTQEAAVGRNLEYRLTAIHEAWPGHHLLDLCRWSLPRSLRRPLEHPLFYEGWACLAEEIMFRTGYLDEGWDRFLLTKRRLERAARGLVDLGVQRGRLCIDEAVSILVSVGYSPTVARAIIPKYLLRPGYQVCYTLGLRQSLELLDYFGDNDLGTFVRTFLSYGEIGLDRMSVIFKLVKTTTEP